MIKLSILIPVWNQEELVVKCLDSIPRRDDIEVIVCDDGSTDKSLAVLRKYKKDHPELKMTVLFNKENRWTAATCNRMLEKATGEYFTTVGSDDYLYTEEYERVMAEMDGTDIVCFDLQINDGTVFKVREETKRGYCAQSIRFVRMAFAEGLRFPEDVRYGADYCYNEECLKRNPTHKFTGIVAYHYNFPREGSNYDTLVKSRKK